MAFVTLPSLRASGFDEDLQGAGARTSRCRKPGLLELLSLFLFFLLGPHSAVNAAFPAMQAYYGQSCVTLGVEFSAPANPNFSAEAACETTRAQCEIYYGSAGVPTASVSGNVCSVNYYLGKPPTSPAFIPGLRQYTIRTSSNECPINSTRSGTSCTCNANYRQKATGDGCYQAETVDILGGTKPTPAASCTGFGNPIFPLTGSKKETVDTGLDVGGQALRLTYDSARQTAAAAASVAAKNYGDAPSFGALWLSSLHRNFVISPAGFNIKVYRGDGTTVSFRYQGNAYVTDADSADQLVAVSGGYRYTDAARNSMETYNSKGQLTSLTDAVGNTLSFAYSAGVSSAAPAAGYLVQVMDNAGRTLRFEYSLPSGGAAATDGRVSKVVNTVGRAVLVSYDTNGNLASLTWEDGKVRQFRYENASFTWALTGVVDENNSRLSTFAYDSAGRAISTELAGGVNHYGVSYGTPPSVAVSQTYDAATLITSRSHEWQAPAGVTLATPNGQSSSLGAATILGAPPVITSISQPAGSGCSAASSASTFDASGNLASRDDFNGQRSCYAYDNRNRETARVEGLANTASCAAVLAPNAGLPAGSRKLSTQWHPDWRIASKEAQPLSIITSIHNGQPDPFNGNALASCAPAGAKTPDGKPIAVLCKQVMQATTDVDGSQGLAATIDTSVAQRMSSFTYDTLGRVLTSTDALNRVTTYSYYATSTDFTVPSTNADAYFDSVGLLLHMDGANNSTVFTDNSASHKAVTTKGTAKISTAQSKFGGSAGYFDGTNSYLSITDIATFNPSAGDYTVELYARATGPLTGQSRDLLAQSDSGGGYTPFIFRHSTAGNWAMGIYNGSAYQSIDGGPITLNQWVHLAMVKSGTTIIFYVDGVSKGSFTIANGGLLSTLSEPMSIGRLGSYNGNYFTGYIDELRVTKGVARYTANFTPPTQAFPDTSIPTLDPNAVGHRAGDLQTVTNAAGHVTQFTLYDGAGRVKQMVDLNGVVTDTVYTPRGWASSVAVTAPGGTARTTSYTYDNAGQLTGATLPDGSTLGYSYDAAHRLTGVTDAKGNTVTYTLDNMGNKVGEQVKDPSGNLQRNITRVYDALNRVQQVTGASN